VDSSTGMGYLQNPIQHKKIGQDCENRFSEQGLNAGHAVGREKPFPLSIHYKLKIRQDFQVLQTPMHSGSFRAEILNSTSETN